MYLSSAYIHIVSVSDSYVVSLEIMVLGTCKLWSSMVKLECVIGRSRFYCSNHKFDLRKLRPMILKRLEERAKEYPSKPMAPVAEEVLKARTLLIRGVSTLLQVYTVWACKHCPEVYVGEKGHFIRSCGGYKHGAKNQIHDWTKATINDIIIPVETYHSGKVVKHDQRLDRISAITELCLQAGVPPTDENINSDKVAPTVSGAELLSLNDLRLIGRGTLKAWETIQLGLQKLLWVYPSVVCKHCSEVKVGPSGNNSRVSVFKYDCRRGSHFLKKAVPEDIFPENVMWFCRKQDPPVLVQEGKDYYGHAPVVVNLCTKAGVYPPSKYLTMMKLQGLSAPESAPETQFESHDI